VLFIKRKGLQPSLAQLGLALEVASAASMSLLGYNCLTTLVRFVYVAVDPVQSEDLFSHMTTMVMLSLPTAISVCVNVLITFYWLDMLQAKSLVDVKSNLKRYKLIGFMVGPLVIATDLSGSVLRGLFIDSGLYNLGSVAVMVSVLLVSGVFYLVAGTMVREMCTMLLIRQGLAQITTSAVKRS
jgi:hypothetical protein